MRGTAHRIALNFAPELRATCGTSARWPNSSRHSALTPSEVSEEPISLTMRWSCRGGGERRCERWRRRGAGVREVEAEIKKLEADYVRKIDDAKIKQKQALLSCKPMSMKA